MTEFSQKSNPGLGLALKIHTTNIKLPINSEIRNRPTEELQQWSKNMPYDCMKKIRKPCNKLLLPSLLSPWTDLSSWPFPWTKPGYVDQDSTSDQYCLIFFHFHQLNFLWKVFTLNVINISCVYCIYTFLLSKLQIFGVTVLWNFT